jgi:hypothetical protein
MLRKKSAYTRIDWKRFDDRLPSHILKLVHELLPGGKVNRQQEYVVKNSVRGDQHTGSFSIYVGKARRCGVWYDFALRQGGDFIDLWRYVRGPSMTRVEAVKQIQRITGE